MDNVIKQADSSSDFSVGYKPKMKTVTISFPNDKPQIPITAINNVLEYRGLGDES